MVTRVYAEEGRLLGGLIYRTDENDPSKHYYEVDENGTPLPQYVVPIGGSPTGTVEEDTRTEEDEMMGVKPDDTDTYSLTEEESKDMEARLNRYYSDVYEQKDADDNVYFTNSEGHQINPDTGQIVRSARDLKVLGRLTQEEIKSYEKGNDKEVTSEIEFKYEEQDYVSGKEEYGEILLNYVYSPLEKYIYDAITNEQICLVQDLANDFSSLSKLPTEAQRNGFIAGAKHLLERKEKAQFIVYEKGADIIYED